MDDQRGYLGVLLLAVVLVCAIGPCRDNPVTPPDQPDDTATAGIGYLVVIRNNAELTADQAEALILLRAWSNSQPDRVSHLEFSPDAASEDSRIAAYVAKIPAGAALPWAIISRGRVDGRGAKVLWFGPLPATAAELIATFDRLIKGNKGRHGNHG